MAIGETIAKLRGNVGMSQEKFAELFGVSRQSVQKWESGASVPELEKLIRLCKYFDISLDALVFDSNTRITEELVHSKTLKPKFANLHDWESYSSNLLTEYRQSTEEGLELSAYKDVFAAVSRLPKGEAKKRLGDVLFEVVRNASYREDHKYIEPSSLEEIKALRRDAKPLSKANPEALKDKILAAWTGRCCGCLLGVTVEGIRTDELIPFLTETGNYPLHRYILKSDISEAIINKYSFRFEGRYFADEIKEMPADDDTNYTVMAQKIIDRYGRDFTPYDVSRAWLSLQGKDCYCTAERVAYCNFIKGFEPPESADYKNPYREWIGAQIRADYFGYINPADPETAAEMAFRDASISHIKNGIYGEMLVAAMLATAAVTDDMKEIIMGGLSQIPYTSRLYEAVLEVLTGYESGVTEKECFAAVHRRYDEHDPHDWCHTISNAVIVTAALLYGKGDYGRSICMAVETGFDTDCNGATIGSILGMANGMKGIPEYWQAPINNSLYSTIFGAGSVKLTDYAERTLKHIKL